MNELNEQQTRVESRLRTNWEKTLEYNDAIDTRAKALVTASSVIVGIITAAKFLPQSADSTAAESLLLGLVCLCSVAMYWFAVDVWKFTRKSMPGTTDVDKVYDQYIGVDLGKCFNNELIDMCEAFNQCLIENERKSEIVEKLVKVFQVQILLLAIAVGWSGVVVLIKTICCG